MAEREREWRERERDELGLRPRLESRNNQLPRYEEAWATFEPNKVFFFFWRNTYPHLFERGEKDEIEPIEM